MDRRQFLEKSARGLAGIIGASLLGNGAYSQITKLDEIPEVEGDKIAEREKVSEAENYPEVKEFVDYYKRFRIGTDENDHVLRRADKVVSEMKKPYETQSWFYDEISGLSYLLTPEQRKLCRQPSCDTFLTSDVMWRIEEVSKQNSCFSGNFSSESAYLNSIIDLVSVSFYREKLSKSKKIDGIVSPEKLSEAYNKMKQNEKRLSFSGRIATIEKEMFPYLKEHFERYLSSRN